MVRVPDYTEYDDDNDDNLTYYQRDKIKESKRKEWDKENYYDHGNDYNDGRD